jgi:formylglycine-generating enzyme required for sulfatase activity
MPTKVFISYSHRDRDFVDHLAEDLKASGVDVWLDRWEIRVGESLTRRVSEGIHEAGYLAVVLSPHSVKSEWVQRELNAGLVKGLNSKRVFLLPILKAPCEIPAIIADIKWADFRESYDHGIQELLARFAPEGGAFEPETVVVPAGEFIMGSDEADNERPAHRVYLSYYRISKYLLTNQEYEPFAVATLRRPGRWSAGRYPEGKGDHPVIEVSWGDAVAYCQWLSSKTGRNYRLPTEAEWEKAASWDPGAEKKRRYPWGDDFDPHKCNTVEGNPGTTTPVGQYSPAGDSPYGAADMAGNVWEWCQDWYAEDYYRCSPSNDPPGPTAGGLRVLRGGSWFYDQRCARCGFRHRNYPLSRDHHMGFRVVVAPRSPELVSGSCIVWPGGQRRCSWRQLVGR